MLLANFKIMLTKTRPTSSNSKDKAPFSAAPEKTRVLIVDDHPVMREGLVRVLERESNVTVCGEAGDITQALKQINSTKPDLVLVDISLRGENGLNLIKEIKTRDPQTSVLVHSMHDETVYAERALRAGANGYLMKHETTQELLRAIRQVLQGEIHLKSTAAKQIVQRLATGRPFSGSSQMWLLSKREFDVLKQIGRGLGTRPIAAAMQISVKTVHVHRANIKRKLHLKESASLVHFAVQWMESQV